MPSSLVAQWNESEVLAYGKKISVSQLDKTLPEMPLEHWLRKNIGESGTIKWELGDCGESTGSPGDNPPLCVEIDLQSPVMAPHHISISVGSMKEGIISNDPNYPHLFHVISNGVFGRNLRSISERNKIGQENKQRDTDSAPAKVSEDLK